MKCTANFSVWNIFYVEYTILLKKPNPHLQTPLKLHLLQTISDFYKEQFKRATAIQQQRSLQEPPTHCFHGNSCFHVCDTWHDHQEHNSLACYHCCIQNLLILQQLRFAGSRSNSWTVASWWHRCIFGDASSYVYMREGEGQEEFIEAH